MLDDGAPQDQHVDSGIAAASGGVLRHAERRLRCRCAPWLHPRHPADLEFADDLVGDLVVEARPIGTGSGRKQRVWTSRISATGAASLSRDFQPVTENPAELSLSLARDASTSASGCRVQCLVPWRRRRLGEPPPTCCRVIRTGAAAALHIQNRGR